MTSVLETKRADYVACYESKLTGRLANLAKLLVDDYFCGSEVRLSDLALFGSLFSYHQVNKELFDKVLIQTPTVAAWWGRLDAALATFLALKSGYLIWLCLAAFSHITRSTRNCLTRC